MKAAIKIVSVDAKRIVIDQPFVMIYKANYIYIYYNHPKMDFDFHFHLCFFFQLFFDDSVRNIASGKEAGLSTVLVFQFFSLIIDFFLLINCVIPLPNNNY